jgi:colanic acid/amylovoran biosynthesis glycosyltransferase
MKIAVMVDQFPCRSETFVLNQITGLIDRGHVVHVYANTRGEIPNFQADIEKYNLGGKVFYFQHGESKIPTNKIVRLVKMISVFHEFGARDAWNLFRTLNVVKYGMAAVSLSIFYQAAVLMRNGPYDIVHGHFGQNGNIAAALKDGGVIKGKVITTFYGYDISEYVQQNGSNVYDFLFSHGDLFVAISENMRDQLLQLGCRNDKIVVHRLGVDLSRFTFDPYKTMSSTKLRVLTIGRFVEKKGLEFGIRAVAQAVKKYPKITYKIVGDGELRDEMTQLIARLNVNKHIELLGWRTPEEVAQLMGEADVFLAPSVTSNNGDQEGTPTVIIEALARGLPVLSTLHSGIPELVQGGRSGFLVPERDSAALAGKLECLCKHPEKCCEMGKAGRDWVERLFDINKLNDQLVNLYDRLLQGIIEDPTIETVG